MHHVWNCRTQATTHKRLEKRERESKSEWGGTSFLTWETSRHKLHTQTHFLVKMCGVRLKGWHNKIKKQKIKEHWPLHCNFFYWSPISDICMLAEQTTRCISKCTNINAATKKHNLLPHSASYQISPKICTTKFKNTIWKKATVTASSSWNQRKELR